MTNLHAVAERVCGPCEWTHEISGTQLSLRLVLCAVGWLVKEGPCVHHVTSYHEALCLRRDQVDEWLAERGVATTLGFGSVRGNLKWCVWKIVDLDDDQSQAAPLTNRGFVEDFDPDNIELFADPDAARVAALEAAEKEAKCG